MAIKFGLLGSPNTGKSYSRKNLPAEDTIVLMPSDKFTYLYNKDKTAAPELTISTSKVDNESFATKLGWKKDVPPALHTILTIMNSPDLQSKASSFNISGSYLLVQDLTTLPQVLDFISKFTSKSIIILADFTHYLTNFTRTPYFQSKSAGYDKYVKMAYETLEAFFTSTIDNLRDDIVVITEFHVEDDESKEQGSIFVPAGKMLKGWFKPESYFDVLLGTYVKVDPDKPKSEWYKFVTAPINNKFIRDLGAFDEIYIPNDLSLVIPRVREVLKNKQKEAL